MHKNQQNKKERDNITTPWRTKKKKKKGVKNRAKNLERKKKKD